MNRIMLRKPRGLIAIFGIAGTVLAGCGSASQSQPTAASHARQTPLMSNPDIGRNRQQSRHPAAALDHREATRSHPTVRADESHVTSAKVVTARETPSTSNDEHSTTGAKPLNPCSLVSLSEAQAITAGAVTKLIEAPLGPTCIYSAQGKSAGVTLAVETESFAQATRHMTASKRVVVSGHRSVCGRLGTHMLFVPLGRYQLLNVTAPCGIALRFAALAVGRLSA
jgi:hypothetical protein